MLHVHEHDFIFIFLCNIEQNRYLFWGKKKIIYILLTIVCSLGDLDKVFPLKGEIVETPGGEVFKPYCGGPVFDIFPRRGKYKVKGNKNLFKKNKSHNDFFWGEKITENVFITNNLETD